MSVAVTVAIKPVIRLKRSESLGLGASGGGIELAMPAAVINNQSLPGPDTRIACAKAWVGLLDLTSSTPVDLDLSALVGGRGDTAFSAVKLIDVRSQEDPSTGGTLSLGGSGGAGEWYDPIGTAAGHKHPIPPGTVRQLAHLGTGWAVGTRHVLRLDPGAANHTALLVIAGD